MEKAPDGIIYDAEDKDMMNMFASVWVKVEVQETDEDNNVNNGSEPENGEPVENPFSEEPKRKRIRRFNKTFKCDTCNYTTVYKNCLELHVLGHNQAKRFACQICDYATKYPTSLHRHVLIRHHMKCEVNQSPDDGKSMLEYKCDQCDYTSLYKWNLNAHKRKHKLEKQFKCPQCSYETAYRHNYIKHSKIHAEGVFFKCDKCPFVTKFEGHITRHLAKIHNEVTEKANKCDFCDFSTKTKWRLNIHKQRSRQENPLKCAYCEFQTFYMCEVKMHKVTHYNEIYVNSKVLSGTENNMAADKVNNSVENISNTQTVLQNVPKDGESHPNKYTLDPKSIDWNNIQVLESEDKERPFLCVMCNYTSKFKASVQRHFQRHHTGNHNRPYKCSNCDFSTKTKDQIALHNKRSQSETELFCPVCKFTTHFKCQLVNHQKCHYAYKCSVCNYSCKHKYELQKHYSVLHLGNSLKCRFCDYKATRKESVLCHETIHTGVKPFKCSYCEYTSVRKALLDNHLKRYHSDIKKDVTVVSESKIQSLKVPMTTVETEFREREQNVQK